MMVVYWARWTAASKAGRKADCSVHLTADLRAVWRVDYSAGLMVVQWAACWVEPSADHLVNRLVVPRVV